MRVASGIAGLLLAVVLLAGCANDPHPASPDTPGDPWHPPSNEPSAGLQDGSDSAPTRVSGYVDSGYTVR